MIALKVFTGEFPRQQAQLLPDNAAQHALDCDFTRGSLIGIRERAQVAGLNAPSGVKSMFVYDGVASSMFAWTRDVNAVRSPIPNDKYSRFYWTDGSGFYVSRGDIGGNGQEPSGTNRYKVGVPTPAEAMTVIVDESKLALPGVSSVDFALFCEGTDSTQEGMTSLPGPVPLTHTTNVWNAQWATTVSCAATAGAAATVGAGTSGTLTYYGAISGFKLFYTAESGGYASLYFRNDDYLNQPLGDSIYVGGASDLYASSGPGYTTHGDTFYSVGSGWYCSNQSGAIPAGSVDTTTTSAAVARTLAMKLTFNVSGGTAQTGVLRLNGQHTLPAEFDKFSFEFNYVPGAAALRISGKVEYKEFRAYAYSYVNQYGEESGLSYPVLIDVVEGQKVTLQYTNLPDSAGYCPVSLIRIYRTATGSGSTDYSFVDEIVYNSTAPLYVDTKMGDELGAPSQSADFAAPEQALSGLCQLGNGILAAFSGNELHFMEPYLPYACRPQYIKPLPHKIIGICPTDDGLYVTTTAYPYIVTGMTPDTMTDRRIPQIQAGVSKGSICALGATVAYASHDGIVLLRGIDASTDMSFQFFTREVWRDLYSNKLHLMRMNSHDGNILVWFEDGTPGFLVRTEEGAVSMTKLSDPIYAAFVYPVGDSLYVAAGSAVFIFKGGVTTKAWEWESKDFILPAPENLGCLQIVGSGVVTFAITADGIQRHTQTATLSGDDSGIFRLPSGFLCRRWSIRIDGAAGAKVTEASLASSPSELQNG